MFRLVARFARVGIEQSSQNKFALNGIQRDYFGGIFSGGIFSEGIFSEGIFSGGILSGYHFQHLEHVHSHIQSMDVIKFKNAKFFKDVTALWTELIK